ncbi:MAG: sulfatase modifying factor 1 [Planctomycetota bacterium]|jgi:sulfatase modifying factor 1
MSIMLKGFLVMALGLQLQACTGICERPSVIEVYEVLAQGPGPEVTDAVMRRKIEQSGHPWKVRDLATGIEMVLVLPGEFLMGSPESEAGRGSDEGPQHRVRLTKAFYLGVTELTQAHWAGLMGETPSFFEGPDLPMDPSWNDVQGFLSKANEGGPVGAAPLRLPTEAEWEYACRAGSTGPFAFDGAISQALVNFNNGEVESAVVVDGKLVVEWVTAPSDGCLMRPAIADSLPPNAWGLQGMHGGLWEWCADLYSASGYVVGKSVAEDPFARATGDSLRTLRGGSWYDSASDCRSAVRDAGGSDVRSNRIGVRLARTL